MKKLLEIADWVTKVILVVALLFVANQLAICIQSNHESVEHNKNAIKVNDEHMQEILKRLEKK